MRTTYSMVLAVWFLPVIAVAQETAPSTRDPEAAKKLFDLPEASEEEYAQGLRAVLSKCTGFSDLIIEKGVAHVYLTGPCTSGGSTYTIAGPVMKTLKQFEEIEFVKLYNAFGNTENPLGRGDSIPFELEP